MKAGETMKNRIKEFRTKKDLTQKECVKSFDEYLKKKNIKGITTATWSRWENGLNAPTEKMWDNLADFFGVTSLVLKGAYDIDEIDEIVQQNYLDNLSGKLDLTDQINYINYGVINNLIDRYLIALGVVPWDIKKNDSLLSYDKAKDLNFWIDILQLVHSYTATRWLSEYPLNIDKLGVLDAVGDALSAEINNFFGYVKWGGFKSTTRLADNNNKAKERLEKREKFLNEHILVLDDKQINEYIKETSNDNNLDAFVHELVKQLSNTYRFFMYDWDMEKIYLKDKKTTQVLLLSDLLTSLLKNK